MIFSTNGVHDGCSTYVVFMSLI